MAGRWGVVYSGKTLRQISAELRKMDDKEIAKRFRKELRAAAAPMVPAVRTAISTLPSNHDGTLRGLLKKAVTLQVVTVGKQAQVTIRVDGRKMPGHMKSLPAMVEGKKKWRHPVYGNRNVWVNQQPMPYFYRTVERFGPATRVRVAVVIRGIERDIS